MVMCRLSGWFAWNVVSDSATNAGLFVPFVPLRGPSDFPRSLPGSAYLLHSKCIVGWRANRPTKGNLLLDLIFGSFYINFLIFHLDSDWWGAFRNQALADPARTNRSVPCWFHGERNQSWFQQSENGRLRTSSEAQANVCHGLEQCNSRVPSGRSTSCPRAFTRFAQRCWPSAEGCVWTVYSRCDQFPYRSSDQFPRQS